MEESCDEMKNILIIEDDKDINNMLKQLLENHNYQVLQAYSGTEGLLIHDKLIDLILLDLMLPGKNGEEIIESLKEKHNIPIIVMSAISEIDKKVNLFELGADDYITKPFHNEELLARIKVQSKNKKEPVSRILKYKDIELNPKEFTVFCNLKQVNLTYHEFELLKTLMEHENQVLTKSVLFELVWGDEDSADDNTLNVHISKLRSKLKEANSKEEYIETIWSVGYRMKK